MNQVININYHGRIIPIETNAYDLLKTYIAALQKHFQHEEGREEIINDIESRISELFHEQLSKGSTCITDKDVNAVIKSMGMPEELESEPVINPSQSDNGNQQKEASAPKRLYRDENNKFLGGVCSGLANYLNIDIVVVRLIFIILFFSFGVGLIPYIILWIVVPSSATTVLGATRKKLYRDPDEKVIAGVCSGLAHYFGIHVWIPRTLFLLPVLSMIFEWNHFLFNVSPSTFVIYIIFWLVMPEAKTTSEKLEMKGEKVDLNSIQQAINEELKGVKERAEKLGKEAEVKVKEFRSDSSNALKRFINAIVNVVVFIVKAISYTTLTLIGIALLLTLLSVGALSFLVFPLKDFILNGTWQHVFAFGTLMFFVILAIVAIIVWVIKKIAGIKTKNKWVTVTFIALWVLGWISLFGLISSLGNDFSKVSHRDNNETTFNLAQPSGGKLFVRFNTSPYYLEKDNDIDFLELMDMVRDSIHIGNVKLKAIRSLDDSFHVRIVKSAHGRSRHAADTTAAEITINISQKDSLLLVDPSTAITKSSKFRNQQVTILISVPEGKHINIPYCNQISNLDNDVWEFENPDYKRNEFKEYEMTKEGLKPLEEMDNIDDKIKDRLDSLDKMEKLEKLHLLDSLIELEKKPENKSDNQDAVLRSI